MVGKNSGQELFSLLILLEKRGLLDQISVICTDVTALEHKDFGRFSAKEMEISINNFERVYSDKDMSLFYDNTPVGVKMKEGLLRNVHFEKLDPIRSKLSQKVDMVILRNQLINCNQTSQIKIESNVLKSLVVGGYLSIGVNERIINRVSANKLRSVNMELKVFKKNRD